MKTIKAIITILIISTAALYSASAILIYDFLPTSMGTGGGYDLLDGSVPLSRTYSGLLGMKEKTGFNYYGAFLPQGVTLHNGSFFLKKDFIKGIKFGAYMTALSETTFTHYDPNGNLGEEYKFSDFLIGIPIAFSVGSLNLREKTVDQETGEESAGVSPGFKKFLNSVNFGLNLNYYKTELLDKKSRTFFTDVNLSTKLKAGYIGMPAKPLTAEMLDAEKVEKVTDYDTDFQSRIAALEANEELSPEDIEARKKEYEEDKAAYEERMNTEYDNKGTELMEVEKKREDLFGIYNDQGAELTAGDITNIINAAISEMDALVVIASNNIEENRDYLNGNLLENINNNQSNITKYRKAFRAACEDQGLTDASERMFDLYKKYVLDKYRRVIVEIYSASRMSAEKYQARIKELNEAAKEYEEYTIVSNDTLALISQNFYGNEEDALLILEYNSFGKKDELEAGSVIRVPIKEKLEEARQRDEKFNTERAAIEMEIGAFQMTPVLDLNYTYVIRKMNQRTEMFEYKTVIDADIEADKLYVNNIYKKQLAAINRTMDTAVKGLKKAQLKKELDKMNAGPEGLDGRMIAEYKKEERAVFDRMLVDITKIKARMIKTMIEGEETKLAYREDNIRKIQGQKAELLDEDASVRRLEVGEDVEALGKIDEELSQKQSLVQSDQANQLADAERSYTEKVEGYEWQLTVNELIYLNTATRKNTLGIGFFAKHLGVPINYEGVKESLPITVGGDMVYQFLGMDRHASAIYGHFHWNKLEPIAAGGGMMYRLLEMFELRGGVSYDGRVMPTAGASLIFNIGLMGARLDGGFKYIPDWGPVFSAGGILMF